MGRIKKSNICDYINSLLDDKCYVGLHSIVDDPTTLPVCLSSDKQENAISIMKNGLINSRGGTLNHTVRFFGDISNASYDIKKKISDYYQGINRSGEYFVEVVAIPYFFEDGLGKKIFGGYKVYDNDSQFNESPECMTDMIFSQCVPSEMILGYYSYDEYEDKVVFVQNPKYYSKLPIPEKQMFIQKYFGGYGDSLDVNNKENVSKMEDSVKRFPNANDCFFNTLRQYISLKKESLTNLKNVKSNYSRSSFLENDTKNVALQIEYPDGKIHNVMCYRFCKSKLKDGKYVYFIEYIDKIGDKDIDSYAVLENIYGRFYKSDIKIDYSELNKNVIRDITLDILPDNLFMKSLEQGINMIKEDKISQEEKSNAKKNIFMQTQNCGGNSGKKNDIQNSNKKEQIVFIVLPVNDGSQSINFDLIESISLINERRINSFIYESDERIKVNFGHSYSDDCKILNPFLFDNDDVNRIISYLREKSMQQDFNANELEDIMVGNCRCKFIPSIESQYKLVSFSGLQKIYLPTKIDHDVNVENMFFRYMNHTALGFLIINSREIVTEPGINLAYFSKIHSLLDENISLRYEQDIDPKSVIQPYDSYEYDDLINELECENSRFKLLKKMSPDELKEYKKRKNIERGIAFANFFEKMRIDMSDILKRYESERISTDTKSTRQL